MPSQPEQFVELLADHQVDVDELTNDSRDAFARRYRELLENPDQRLDGIMEAAVLNVAARMATEFDDEDIAEEMAERMLDGLDMSWSDLHRVPVGERGPLWSRTRRIMSAVSWRQAFIEVEGPALFGMSVRHEVQTAREAKRLGDAGVRAAAQVGGLRTAVKANAAKRKAGLEALAKLNAKADRVGELLRQREDLS